MKQIYLKSLDSVWHFLLLKLIQLDHMHDIWHHLGKSMHTVTMDLEYEFLMCITNMSTYNAYKNCRSTIMIFSIDGS